MSYVNGENSLFEKGPGPDLFQQFGLGDQPPGVSEERCQDVVLLAR